MAFLLKYYHSIYDSLRKERQVIFEKFSVFLWVLGILFSFPLHARGMQQNLEKAFGVLGMANVTPGGAFQDQSGGFYTGGSVFARSKANTAEIFSLQMPHYRAGCGGIDLFMGGISFINA
jgi:conjugative transfer pilus assembly protein TraH